MTQQEGWAETVPLHLRELHGEASSLALTDPARSHELTCFCLMEAVSDFCGIDHTRLDDQISELCDRWEARDMPPDVPPKSVRLLQDFCRRSDVLQGSAQVAADGLRVIERLFDDWYTARADRSLRRSRVRLLMVLDPTRGLAKPLDLSWHQVEGRCQ